MAEFSSIGRQDVAPLPSVVTPVIAPITNFVETSQSAMEVTTTLSDISILLYLGMQARRKRAEEDFPALSLFFRRVD